MKPTVHRLPVLVEEACWPKFQAAVQEIGSPWTGPSGLVYELDLRGYRLQIDLVLESYDLPPREQVDGDLLEYACLLQDTVGDPWSGQALRELYALWTRRAV
jgi:hypothetical protein